MEESARKEREIRKKEDERVKRKERERRKRSLYLYFLNFSSHKEFC